MELELIVRQTLDITNRPRGGIETVHHAAVTVDDRLGKRCVLTQTNVDHYGTRGERSGDDAPAACRATVILQGYLTTNGDPWLLADCLAAKHTHLTQPPSHHIHGDLRSSAGEYPGITVRSAVAAARGRLARTSTTPTAPTSASTKPVTKILRRSPWSARAAIRGCSITVSTGVSRTSRMRASSYC